MGRALIHLDLVGGGGGGGGDRRDNGLFVFHLTSYSPFSLLLITVWIALSDVLVIRWLCAIAFAGPKDLPELQSTMPHLALGYATYDDLKNLSQVKKIRRRKIP